MVTGVTGPRTENVCGAVVDYHAGNRARRTWERCDVQQINCSFNKCPFCSSAKPCSSASVHISWRKWGANTTTISLDMFRKVPVTYRARLCSSCTVPVDAPIKSSRMDPEGTSTKMSPRVTLSSFSDINDGRDRRFFPIYAIDPWIKWKPVSWIARVCSSVRYDQGSSRYAF